MKTRKLRNIEVSSIGIGCMGFSHGYGQIPSESESIRLMRKAYNEYGCTLFDTAEVYATFENEILVGKAIKPFRDKIVLSTKFMPKTLPGQEIAEGKLSRKGLRMAVEGSLKRLQTDYIDLYYEHRVPIDSNVEEMAMWMGELIAEGKIRGWGQSEPSIKQAQKAHAVTPISAIQNEYSIMNRASEKEFFDFCDHNNIGFVAYSPMASGFLSGKYNKNTEYKGDDVRRVITRFTPENVEKNQPLLDLLNDFAISKNTTTAQISLAWMLHKKPFIVPIPGMRKDERMEENFGAVNIEFTDEEFNEIEEKLSKIKIYGDRKDSDIQKLGTIVTVAKS